MRIHHSMSYLHYQIEVAELFTRSKNKGPLQKPGICANAECEKYYSHHALMCHSCCSVFCVYCDGAKNHKNWASRGLKDLILADNKPLPSTQVRFKWYTFANTRVDSTGVRQVAQTNRKIFVLTATRGQGIKETKYSVTTGANQYVCFNNKSIINCCYHEGRLGEFLWL
jgi:hypothetical protein